MIAASCGCSKVNDVLNASNAPKDTQAADAQTSAACLRQDHATGNAAWIYEALIYDALI
jgi:hypothetical protein